MSTTVSCPVSNTTVNEYRVRIVASFISVATLFYFLVPNWVIPAVQIVDFFMRGIGFGRYSPFGILGGQLVKALALGTKPIDQAPKVFAARMGLAMSCLLLLAEFLSLTAAAYEVDGLIVVFASLESVLGFCAGCHVYTLVRRVFPAAPHL